MGWYTAQCKMLLFCAKTILKESCNFELPRLKKEKHFGLLATFWFNTFTPLDMLFVMKSVKDEQYVVIKACKFTVFERFSCIII